MERTSDTRSPLPRRIAALMVLVVMAAATATAQYRVVHLEKPYNTPGSETGAIVVGDTMLVYASMQTHTTKHQQFSFNTSLTQLYQARIAKSGKVAKPRPNRWGLNSKKEHTGNLAVDPLSKDLYFTRADVESLDCAIYYARKIKRGWMPAVKLRGPVNTPGYTSTQPTVARLADSTVILYFSSNRPGGSGGMDLWYTIVKGSNTSECVNLGPLVNSPADEITPFYDQPNGTLYFSSDRMGGQGGHDIYCAVGQRNAWQQAEPVCGCLNSEENDIYFTITERDSATGMPTGGYLASNRKGSYFLTDSTCCNDLYRWGLDTSVRLQTVAVDTVESIDTIEQRVRRFMFPLFLYFHNDEPDPSSREATTASTYSQCQQRYAALRNLYLTRQTSAQDSALIAEFFDSCVVGNYARVEQLFEYIESLLDADQSITLTIAGYASPVYRSDYNLNLSGRRIAAFINMVRQWRGGVFEDAIASGTFLIVQRPHGAVEPTTASRSTDPVYGLPAALARRIEVLSCEIR